MLRFNDVADKVLEHHPDADLDLLQRAYVFAARAHEGQQRLSGEPYLIHPLEVAGILAVMRLDAAAVVAGLLHDALEDTLTTAAEIRRLFGEEVAFLVEGLTKIAKIEFSSARERQAESFRKMLVAMSKDIRILLIKLADRLHNMRTLGFMQEDARQRIAQETMDIYAPLARRLGIEWMRRDLVELAFRVLRPQLAEQLENQLQTRRQERARYVDEVIAVLGAKLTEVGLAYEIESREKELASIAAKMEAQSVGLDQIHDVIAFRVILDAPSESVYTALGMVHATWRPVPGRFKDYVALPKPNGYQSLHTTVIGPDGERMEVQIRTRDMHRAAEFGIAAHWRYKERRDGGGAREDEDEQKFAWLRQLLDRQQEVSDPHEFLDAVKVDLFPDEVFVFTPQGDVINLPRGATPLDFAYAIHSEVGSHCAGARVNGRIVPLRHVLKDGDTLEILTSEAQFPRKDWLDFVVSGKARSKIRHAIRIAEHARSRELGRDILEKELRRAGHSLARLLENGAIEALAQKELSGAPDDLFSAVGYGKLTPAPLVAKLRGEEPAPPPEPRRRRIFGRARSAPSTSGVRVDGVPDVLVRFASCCNPLAGDEVIGFVTRGRGVTVHQKDCQHAFTLDPDRRISVEWETKSVQPRLIKVRAISRDQPGVLAKITKSISTAGVNIGAARVKTSAADQTAEHEFDLWVADLRALKGVMKEIERVRGVLSVERVRT